MKLFYCPECQDYGEFLVIMAENIEECEEKMKSFLDLDTRKRAVPLRFVNRVNIGDKERVEWSDTYVKKTVDGILANKKNWEEIESGIFNGEWS